MTKLWFERKSPINEEFNNDLLFSLLESTDNNVLVTGAAGTGKSTVLRKFVELTKKSCVVLAPTGIAATNVKGQTIHSFFRLPHKLITAEDLSKDSKLAPLCEKIQTLVIDEISMVRRDVFDAMDKLLRKYKSKNKPFGGVQLVMFGDMYQLPPIVLEQEKQMLNKSYGNDSNYFFDSKAYAELDLIVVRLNHVYRQNDAEFVEILTRMQKDGLSDADLARLNERVIKKQAISDPRSAVNLAVNKAHSPQKETAEDWIILSTVNRIVDRYNKEHLDALAGSPVSYVADVEGDVRVEKDTRAMETLELKKGARVMLLVNNKQGGYFNGSLGTVVGLNKGNVEVRLDSSSETIFVDRFKWEIEKYRLENGEIVKQLKGSISQFPLRLAWAMTVHKSQGQTLEKVLIDFEAQPWECGHAYVAFSRVRSLEGLRLKTALRKTDVKIDDDVSCWEKNLKQEKTRNAEQRMITVSGIDAQEATEIIKLVETEYADNFGVEQSLVHWQNPVFFYVAGIPMIAEFIEQRIILMLDALAKSKSKEIVVHESTEREIRLAPTQTAAQRYNALKQKWKTIADNDRTHRTGKQSLLG